jgi:GNAT superfamily N-acetyltransferase
VGLCLTRRCARRPPRRSRAAAGAGERQRYAVMEFIDLRPKAKDPELRRLFALAVGRPTSERLAAVADEYASAPERFLLGVVENDVVLGLVGGSLESADGATIAHIAVRPERQRGGLGRRLVQAARDRLHVQALTAHTDRDAVHFYERCGFQAQSLGELYPGVARFVCSWRAASGRHD